MGSALLLFNRFNEVMMRKVRNYMNEYAGDPFW